MQVCIFAYGMFHFRKPIMSSSAFIGLFEAAMSDKVVVRIYRLPAAVFRHHLARAIGRSLLKDFFQTW